MAIRLGWPEVLAAYRRPSRIMPSARAPGTGGGRSPSPTSAPTSPLTHVFVAAARSGISLQSGSQRRDDRRRRLLSDQHRAAAFVCVRGAGLAQARRPQGALRIETDALVRGSISKAGAPSASPSSGGGATISARARREVILCGGAINTRSFCSSPALARGGPERLGLAVRHDLPAVGAHLQDHLCHDQSTGRDGRASTTTCCRFRARCASACATC